MNAFVIVASKHGSTREIGETIAGELRTMGIAADVRDLSAAPNLTSADAIVLGSAVYVGRWLPEAVDFTKKHRDARCARPVWLFNSGPRLADQLKAPGDPQLLDDLMEATRARGHRAFSGRLDSADLGPGERLIAKIVHAPIGDFRDWDAINAWVRDIGAFLSSASPDVHGAAMSTLGPQPEERT